MREWDSAVFESASGHFYKTFGGVCERWKGMEHAGWSHYGTVRFVFDNIQIRFPHLFAISEFRREAKSNLS